MHIKRDDCFNDLIAENRIYDKVLSLWDIKEKEVERNQSRCTFNVEGYCFKEVKLLTVL